MTHQEMDESTKVYDEFEAKLDGDIHALREHLMAAHKTIAGPKQRILCHAQHDFSYVLKKLSEAEDHLAQAIVNLNQGLSTT